MVATQVGPAPVVQGLSPSPERYYVALSGGLRSPPLVQAQSGVQEVLMSRLLFVSTVVLCFLCPAYAGSNAVLRCNGAVKVNGVPAKCSTVVMEGDRIETGKHSSASLLLPGKLIPVGTSSGGVFHNGNLVPSVASAKDKDDKNKDKGDNDNDKDKKKCISPKKPGRDKDCDDDGDNDHDNGH
jgi:hypothetical protein